MHTFVTLPHNRNIGPMENNIDTDKNEIQLPFGGNQVELTNLPGKNNKDK